MAFVDSEEHSMIRDAVREIATEYDRDYWRRHFETKTVPREYWQELADGGWLGIAIPEEYGGEGYGMQEVAIVLEELTRGGDVGATSTIFVMTPIFGGIGFARHGTAAQKERYLPEIADGEIRFCLGLTEANAGTNTLNMETAAERDGNEFVVSGQKMWTSGAETADHMILAARTSPSSDTGHGITLFVVPEPSDQPEISLTPVEVGVPQFDRQYQVDIDSLRVSGANTLGEIDEGMNVLWDILNTERIAGAAFSVGGGLRAIDLAVEYANNRAVFGQPIGAHQGIQHPLAEAYTGLLCARQMAYKAAWQWDNGEDAGKAANTAKFRASKAATAAADHAIQTHGGNGFTPEHEVYDIWQLMRLTQTVPITNEMVLNYIAEHELGLPRSY